MTDGVTPPATDPGDISPPITRDAKSPATERPSFAQQRQAQDQAAADAAKPPAAAAKDPAAAGDKHKFGEMEFTEQELRDYLTAKGDAELKKATLPATPADYKTELPATFELPAGIKEFTFDETDPALSDARAWAFKQGLSQSQFSEMISLHAAMQAREEALYNTAAAAEVAKLGANGTQRVTALETWMRGMVGDELAGAMRGMLVTEKIVRGWKKIQGKFSSQGGASFSQSGRVAPEANPIPNYQAMTFAQRRQAQDDLRR